MSFGFRDISGHAFLSKNDPVHFLLLPPAASPPPGLADSAASADSNGSLAAPSSLPRAVEVTLLPLTATVSTVAAAASAADSSGSPSSSGLGLLTLMSGSSSAQAEQVVYSALDVLDGAAASLHCGDVVSIGSMSFHAERKRRQARQLRLVKAAPRSKRLTGSSSQNSISAAAAGGEQQAAGAVTDSAAQPQATTTMRFARGPDQTRGFAPRGSARGGVQVGLQRSSSSE